eukprot:scaffold430951_cov19-Prasinocladus_malaysianus.AAC.1
MSISHTPTRVNSSRINHLHLPGAGWLCCNYAAKLVCRDSPRVKAPTRTNNRTRSQSIVHQQSANSK